MSNASADFDHWIRNRFIELNTQLEEMYFIQEDRANVTGVGDHLKQALLDEGNELIRILVSEGNTDEGFDANIALLGNVGFFMAACRRHDLTEPSRETRSPLQEASTLALHLGASVGMTPRFATCHLITHNKAINGRYKSFTSLKDEEVFNEQNAIGVLSYQRAADALRCILPLGISHPVSFHLFKQASAALEGVIKSNEDLYNELDVDRFFYSVRPYYKPYRVGLHEYRGANAGDFAGINEIDLLLGLCHAEDSSYSQLLVDKFLFMMPDDRKNLRDCMRRKSFLKEFMEALPDQTETNWYKTNLPAFLETLETHGRTALQHHNLLVDKFIQHPSMTLDNKHHNHLTASGPPLPVLLRSLEKLRDQRMAAHRDDNVITSFAAVQQLKASLT